MMELAVNRKTLKIEYQVTNTNNHAEIIFVKRVEGFNEDNQTLKVSDRYQSFDLKKFNKKYRMMQVY